MRAPVTKTSAMLRMYVKAMLITTVLVASLCWAAAVPENPFVRHFVVPDVIDEAPKGQIEITYSPTVKAQFGNELTPTQVKIQPSVSWPAEAGALYTLVMTDPESFKYEKPGRKEFLHFMVGNIPENDISKGTLLFEYVGAGPPQGTGTHRYVWLVYKQTGPIDFNQATVSRRSTEHRSFFSIRKFAAEKKLGLPIAGNFFLSEYDDYVPQLLKELNGQ